MDLLEGGDYRWVHVAAHGSFYPAAPDADSALWLQGGQALNPDAIVGPDIETHLAEQRPVFVFNCCEVGRQGWSLTRIGGWANRLIGTGAGLYIGPHWIVSDGPAKTFALSLYDHLLSGDTVAAAVRKARLAARKQGDPTWLAYSVYAHPNARVVAG
jgi:CHAT domain-containing protein